MKTKAYISAVSAFLYAVPFYFILKIFCEDALSMAVISGSIFYILLFLFLVYSENKANKRYEKAEKTFKEPFWYKINGNITTDKGVRNTNIYFTDSSLIFLSLDKKPYIAEEIPVEKISKCEVNQDKIINLVTVDDHVFVIAVPDVENLKKLIKEHGWFKS